MKYGCVSLKILIISINNTLNYKEKQEKLNVISNILLGVPKEWGQKIEVKMEGN